MGSRSESDSDYACPKCGSCYFLSARTRPRMVFRLKSKRTPEILEQDDGASLNATAISCGACSWQGTIEQTILAMA